MNSVNSIDLLTHLTLENKEDIDEHLMTLFAMTLSMKPSIIVELGVRSGRSTLAFLCGCESVNARLYSVDINNPTLSFNFPGAWTQSFGGHQRWTFMKKDALKFLEEDFPSLWNDKGNIIYIDDWHAGDHVKKELELISPYVSPRDLIILHDLMYGDSQPNYRSVENPEDKQWDNGGPYAAVSELDLNQWEYMTIPRCNGLTLLRKKADRVINV